MTPVSIYSIYVIVAFDKRLALAVDIRRTARKISARWFQETTKDVEVVCPGSEVTLAERITVEINLGIGQE